MWTNSRLMTGGRSRFLLVSHGCLTNACLHACLHCNNGHEKKWAGVKCDDECNFPLIACSHPRYPVSPRYVVVPSFSLRPISCDLPPSLFCSYMDTPRWAWAAHQATKGSRAKKGKRRRYAGQSVGVVGQMKGGSFLTDGEAEG